MISKWLVLVVGFALCEIIIAVSFSVTSQLLYKKLGFDFKSIIKGIIERLFLVISLFNGYHHGLTFFSAIKVATRLRHSESDPLMEAKFNDYYLVGNLISVSFAIGYVLLLKHCDTIKFFKLLVD